MSQARSTLFGRERELAELGEIGARPGVTGVVVSGASGVGKTKLVEAFCESTYVGASYERVITCPLYRTGWTSALAYLRKDISGIPPNATQEEIEDAILELARTARVLLVLDNVDDHNVNDVSAFITKWSRASLFSLLVITAQTEISAVLPRNLCEMPLAGLSDEDDVLGLLGNLGAALPVPDLMQAAEVLDGNPQLLLFMQWMEPRSVASLRQLSENLADRKLAQAVEELVSQSSLPTLFFLALGVHKDTIVSQRLLAALWDHFGARGAEPFIRSLQLLIERRFLTPTSAGDYRLHESVHVSLPKALRHRVGDDRVPSLHHYFAEYYRRVLHHAPASIALTRFIYHARLADDYLLIYDTLIGDRIVEKLASTGTVLQVRVELESLVEVFSSGVLRPHQLCRLYLALGRLCNTLSEHEQALNWMRVCAEQLEREDIAAATGVLRRDIWYVSAVAYSNTGQSDACLQNYFRIVASCADDTDSVACLSLGYLAHDLKYRDLDDADRIGSLSIEWARSFESGPVLAKNLCSYAETLALSRQDRRAGQMYREAQGIAISYGDRRELGRIMTNWGFVDMLSGGVEHLRMIDEGIALSKELGDRRRHLQGILYRAVALVRSGDKVAGRSGIVEAAQGFRSLGDGRYFAPAVLWLLQMDSQLADDLWGAVELSVLRSDTRHLVEHARAHPEYLVYANFWYRCLADYVGASQA
jgi:hypothetical protein